MSTRTRFEKEANSEMAYCFYLICYHKYYTFLDCDWFKRAIGQFLIGLLSIPITIKTAFQDFKITTKATTGNFKVERLQQ